MIIKSEIQLFKPFLLCTVLYKHLLCTVSVNRKNEKHMFGGGQVVRTTNAAQNCSVLYEVTRLYV